MDWGVELETLHQAWMKENSSTHTVTLTKRPASSTNDYSAPNKKAKTADVGPIADAEIRDHFNKNSINKVNHSQSWRDKCEGFADITILCSSQSQL